MSMMLRVATMAMLAMIAGTPRPHPMTVTEGDIFLADSTRLHYYTTDAAPDTIIVPLGVILLPGLRALAERHTLIFYDPRGRGRSSEIAVTDARSHAFQRDVSDLDTIRTHFSIKRATILGWSFYSLVAARYAMDHPKQTRRVILVSALAPRAVPYGKEVSTRYDARLDVPARKALDSVRVARRTRADSIEYCRRNNALYVPANLAHRGRDVSPQVDPCDWPNEWPEAIARSTGRSLADLGNFDWRKALVSVRVPFLIIHGDEDAAPLAGTMEWSAAPGARVIRMPDAAHWSFIESPDAFQNAVEWFLATH